MRSNVRLLDIVYVPIVDKSNLIKDNEGNLDIGNILSLTFLMIFLIVLSVLIIRKIRRGI